MYHPVDRVKEYWGGVAYEITRLGRLPRLYDNPTPSSKRRMLVMMKRIFEATEREQERKKIVLTGY